jgi:hypothetical protein
MTRMWARFAIAAVCALSVAACTDITNYNANDNLNPGGTPSGGTPSDSVRIENFALSPSTIWIGGTTCGPTTATASATTSPAGRSVVYSSQATNVATVNGNVITGVNIGTAVIRAAVSGTSVYQDKQITVMLCQTGGGSLSFTPQNPTGTVGTTLQLTLTCTYSNCDPRFSSSNPGVISVNEITGLLTFVSVGTAEICMIHSTAQPNIKFCGTGTSNSGGGGQPSVYPGNVNQNGCSPITFQLRDGAGNPITSGVAWSSTGSGMNSSTGVFTPSTPGNFTVSAAYNNHVYTANVTITGTCGSGGNISVSVNPKTLTLTLGGGSGQLTATVTGATPSGTWSLPENKGCVSLSVNGTVATVSPVKLCSEIVRYTQAGVSDQAVVTVNAGASSCTWSNASGSNVYNNYTYNQPFQAVGNCVYQGVQQQPYWYSKDPSRFTVQGAPYVCMISGVPYPCGTSATIKPIYYGSTDICDQAAVQDNSVFFCRTVSTNPLTAPSGLMAPDWTPDDSRQGFEMVLPTAPPKGAKIDQVITWDEYVRTHAK